MIKFEGKIIDNKAVNTIIMPYIELDKGKGKNIVFIHGFLGSTWLFEAQIDYFSSNYRAIAIDHLGHGKSDKPESESMNNLIPNSTLSVLTPKIGHMIQYEAPEQYTAAIENFLKNI